MEDLVWLISNDDICDVTNNYEFDIILDMFVSNGITSPENAYWNFHSSRFEYSQVDCPFCNCMENNYRLKNETWLCKKCRKHFSLTSQTYLDNTKLEMYKWWRFAYLIGDMKITNSCIIARDLKVTQKTSWWMLDTLREARKENTEHKFINGAEVLKFNNSYEVVNLLTKRKKILTNQKNSTKNENTIQSK